MIERRRNHLDARGWLCEVARASLEGEIAQVYVTTCNPGVVKGWHRHELQTDRLFCAHGAARVVVGRAQHASTDRLLTTNSFEVVEDVVIGPESPGLVVIPPGLWHAFAAVGPGHCVIVNAVDREYDGTDEERAALSAFPFDWEDVSR